MFALENNHGAVVLVAGEKRIRISFISQAIARITVTEGKPFQIRPSLIVTATSQFTDYKCRDGGDAFEISTPALKLFVDKVFPWRCSVDLFIVSFRLIGLGLID